MAAARGQWNSRFGFIMAAVGSAVGLGNLVRFPRELAENGGAAFLFVYLGLLLLVGLPAILGEMSLGKLSRMSPVNAFKQLGGRFGRQWAALGVFGLLAAVFVLFFYTVMTGWTLRFFLAGFTGGWFDDPNGYYDAIAYGPWSIFWNFLVVAITVYIIARGVSGGIEKVTTVIMPALFAIIVALVVYALFQPGMGAGYSEIFRPDFSVLASNPQIITSAVGQVFFSLSLGQGAMLTYASYMDRKQSVTEDGSIVAFTDSGVAVLAGMMIFPTLAFTGLLFNPDTQATLASGSFGTAFIALPNAFVAMGDVTGRIVGTVFFLGLFFAALSSAISLLEVPVSVLVDNLGLARPKAAILVGLVIYAFGVLSSISETWLVLYDEIAVNVFIVVGVALTTFFAGWWAKGVRKELERGMDHKASVAGSHVWIWFMRTITPVAILAVFIYGGLWGADGFWTDGAGWKGLGHDFRLAFGGS